MNARIACFAFLVMTSLWGWADQAMPGDEPPTALQRQPSPEGAAVEISNIEDGALVPPTFLVQFSVTGMGIAPAGSNIANTGHHHLLIDVVELPDPNLPLPKSDQFMHFGGGQTEAELTLPEGEHTLQLVFADYLHIPHDPVVKSTPITIVVTADAETASGEPDED